MPENDPTRFVSTLLKHQDDLLRFILPLVGCFDDAQDVLQETATAMWRKYSQYDESQPFLPWAKQFARNEVLMHHRKRRRYSFLTDELIELLSAEQAAEESDADMRRQALSHCLEKLPEKDRLLIDRRYAERGLTLEQLASESNTSANRLYKSLGRIRRQLFECVNRTVAHPTS